MKIFGYFRLLGEKPRFSALKKTFGKEFNVRNEVGSLNVDAGYKTLDILLDMLIGNYKVLQKSKIKEIAIYIILAYRQQCNWEASPEQINKLNFLKATLCVSAYLDDEDE